MSKHFNTQLVNTSEINSIWVLTLFKFNDAYYQAHMSLFLVLAWLGYNFYAESSDLISAALQLLAVIVLIMIYELSRLIAYRLTGYKFLQVSLYPFAGVSDVNRKVLANNSLNSSQSVKLARAECVPALVLAAIAVVLYLTSAHTNNQIIVTSFFTCIVLSISALLPVTPFAGGYLLLFNQSNASNNALPTLPKLILLCCLIATATWLNSITFSLICFTYVAVAIEQHLYEKTRLATQAWLVSDIAVNLQDLITFEHGIMNSATINKALFSFQPFFPLLLQDRIIGIIKRNDLIKAAASQLDVGLSELAEKSYTAIQRSAPLASALESFHQTAADYLLVFEDNNPEKITAVLYKEKLFEFLLINSNKINLVESNSSDLQ